MGQMGFGWEVSNLFVCEALAVVLTPSGTPERGRFLLPGGRSLRIERRGAQNAVRAFGKVDRKISLRGV
jgi:hypothetical protein